MSIALDFTAANGLTLNALRLRQNAFTETVSRISSGLRLATAADDVGAWLVSGRLSTRARGWHEASQNIQNGISLVETADGGIQAILDTLARMRELAVAAASGHLADDDRRTIDQEMVMLRQSISRTIDTTQFNGAHVLRGTGVRPPPLVDLANLLTPAISSETTAQTETGTYPVEITQLAQRAAVIGNQPATPLPPGDPPTLMTIVTPAGSVTVVLTDSDPPSTWPALINAAAAGIDVTAQITTSATLLDDGTQIDPLDEGFLLLRTGGVGSDASLSVSTNKFVDSTGFTATPVSSSGADMQGTLNGVAFSARGLTITAGLGASGATGLRFTYAAAPPLGPGGFVDVTVQPENITDFVHIVQFAPDHLDEHHVRIPSMRVDTLAESGAGTVGEIDVTTQHGAWEAIDTLDAAIEQVGLARTKIGSTLAALHGELGAALAGAYVLDTAGARIVDADLALEATTLAQEQLAQQTTLSVLQAIHSHAAASLDFVVRMLQATPLQPSQA